MNRRCRLQTNYSHSNYIIRYLDNLHSSRVCLVLICEKQKTAFINCCLVNVLLFCGREFHLLTHQLARNKRDFQQFSRNNHICGNRIFHNMSETMAILVSQDLLHWNKKTSNTMLNTETWVLSHLDLMSSSLSETLSYGDICYLGDLRYSNGHTLLV